MRTYGIKANVFIIPDKFPFLQVDGRPFCSLTTTIGSLMCSEFSFHDDGL